jgi:SHAQKYF class myb-like DNA-binding protein
MPGNPYKDIYHRKTTMPKPQGWSDAINNGVWSDDEHKRFMEALRMYPGGPWRLVAEHVGTRTVRQVQTHMQKINEKARRHRRGLHKKRKDRPSSEPIGAVSVIISSSSSEDGESEDGVIFEPLAVSPTWSASADPNSQAMAEPFTATGDNEWLFGDVILSELTLDGMDDILGSFSDNFSC